MVVPCWCVRCARAGRCAVQSSMPPAGCPPKRPRRTGTVCSGMPTSFASAQLALDLVGVFVFALSGGLVAVKKRFDLFGVLVLACAAALGGGIMRDLLIGDVPPVGISDWRLLTAAALGGLVTFLFHPGVERITRFVRVLDAAGLGCLRRRRQPQGRDDARGVARSPPSSSASSPRSAAASSATCWPARCPRCCAASCTPCPPARLGHRRRRRAARLAPGLGALGRGGSRLRRAARSPSASTSTPPPRCAPTR